MSYLDKILLYVAVGWLCVTSAGTFVVLLAVLGILLKKLVL